MGRIRKPTALLAPDAFRRNPKRARPAEPKPSGPLGDAPKNLTASEKACWKELAANTPEKVLTNADRWLVELACRIMAKVRDGGIGGRHGASVGELAQLNQSLSKMGLTPSDRAKISVAKETDKKNPFAALDDDEDNSGFNAGSRPN